MPDIHYPYSVITSNHYRITIMIVLSENITSSIIILYICTAGR